jgi:spermidine synthase
MSRARPMETVIAERGNLVVERDRHRPSGRLLRQGGMDASYIDLADPSHLEFDYLRWMRIVLRRAHARRVLHIGGGACALPRALAAEHPDGRQEVCEVDDDVLALAREHLGLRRGPGLRVRRAEGREFLARQASASWDAIVIDAFVGAQVPRNLVTVEALTDAARVAPLALINIVDDRSQRHVRAVAAALMETYHQVWALGGRAGNTVVAGNHAPADLEQIGSRVAADRSPARLTVPLALARLVAGTIAWRDEQP